MKPYEKAFSAIFVFLMFFCVFFRVESWPFSDWRVYEFAMQPKDVEYFVVKQKIEGLVSEPYTGQSYGLKINQEFKSKYHNQSNQEVEEFCTRVFESLSKANPVEEMWVERITVEANLDFNRNKICSRKRS